MKTENERIDEMIKEALSEEEAKFYENLEEQSVLEMSIGVFQGKMKWLAVMTAFIMVIFFALSVYCLIAFLNADSTRDMILWGSGMFGGMMAVTMLKLFHWMQMDKNAIIREIKRLELTVAHFGSKLDK